jgi:hypothetical protein
MNTDYLALWLVCVAEPDGDDAVLAHEVVQQIQRQETSHDIQGANVQVCSKECSNNKIIFRTFRSAKKHQHNGKMMTVTLQGRKYCFYNKPFY